MKKAICILAAACAAALPLAITGCDDKTKDISEYNIYASYDAEKGVIEGNADFLYYNNTQNEISDLKFNLYANAFRDGATYKPVSHAYSDSAYYAGESYGEMKVESVENCAAWNIGGDDENILCVNLTNSVYPEEKVTVSIKYTLSLAKVNHRTGITANTVNLGNFYPTLCAYTQSGFVECPYYNNGDPFVTECANYKVVLDLPKDYTAATSGKQLDENLSGARKKCSYELKDARDFGVVLSDKFQKIEQSVAGVNVSYYYCTDGNPQVTVSAACESLKYFSETFGEYAYPTLSVVQTGFCYGGMEYPALTMISDSLDSDTALYTVVHENAHQWWYAMVGSDQINSAWQDEGLAEYSALMFFENHPNYAFTRTGILGSATKSYRAYYNVYNQIFKNIDTSMNRHLKDYESEYEYVNIAYNKGLILFDTLRNSIGDDKFVSCLKTYFEQNKFKVATCEDLISCFIAVGDLQGVFTSFIEGKIVI